MTSDEGITDRVARFGLLASALAGRTLQVASGEPGEQAWTDGRTVFVDPDAAAHDQLVALAVQASLLAAESLEPDVVRRLAWRPALANRYLGVEGHRALAANARVLPRAVRPLVDRDVAARSDSPAASLAVASSREAIPRPPDGFGTIRARRLLAASGRAQHPAPPAPPARLEDPQPADLETSGEEDAGTASDLFTSPVGGGGALGRLLGRTLEVVRRLDAGGPPGADAPTHRTRAGTRAVGPPSAAPGAPGAVDDAAFDRRATTYPEWDVHRRRYRRDWCTVHEVPAPAGGAPPTPSDVRPLRRALASLGVGFGRCRRQVQGDEIDVDAAIEARVEAMAGSAPDEAVYVDTLRRRRDLAVLLLLDVSGSAAEPGAVGQTVHVGQRAAAAALTVVLHGLGDRVALYAFRSQGRSAVHVVPLKRFDDALDAGVMRRLGGLVPGAYSRLGAAIRHGAAVLDDQGGTSRRLLVVLSDGLAYDHGYEPAYGAADARRALAEARGRGTGCLCLSIGAGSDVVALRRVFGSAAHATIPEPEQLRRVVGPLFRAALRSADVRRRAARRTGARR